MNIKYLEENKVFKFIKKHKKVIIGATVVIASLIIMKHYYDKSWIKQYFSEFDYIRNAPIEEVYEYREQFRIRHINGEPGMMEKLTWIDKVIYNRP